MLLASLFAMEGSNTFWQTGIATLVPAMLCSTHWSNIHHTLLNALPDKSIIHFHHTVTDFDQPKGSNKVKVIAEVGEDKKPKVFEGDFLVACDGSMSSVRAKFRPHDKRRCLLLHLMVLVLPSSAEI